jgi:uncharacterized iron-regulated membrane protein
LRWHGFRNLLQKLHLWVGLALSIPFILIGMSGSILVLLAHGPSLNAPAATARGETQSLVAIVAAARTAMPEGFSPTAVTLPAGTGSAAVVQTGVRAGERPVDRNFQGLNVYVDPVSLKVLGTSERRRAGPFMRFLTTLHIALMAPGHFGLQFVGFMGVAMTLFGITGLILWWPRKGQWRQAFAVKRGARGVRLHRDLHGAFGIWTLAVFLVLSVSGAFLAFPVTFQATVGTILPMENTLTPPVEDPATLASIVDKEHITADEAVRLALAAAPRTRALSVQLPPTNEGVYMVQLTPLPYGDGAPQISVFTGPGAKVYDVVDPRGYASGKRLLAWLRVMHYGQGFGLIWNVLVIAAGFLPLLFGITGYRMWSLKRAQRRQIPSAIPAPAE